MSDIVLSRSEQEQLNAALEHGWRLTPATMRYKLTQGPQYQSWIPARHLMYISTIVATEVAKGGARLILCMPFRHGKSEFLSVSTPIWFLERWPHKFVMNISYGLELATDFSLKVRDTFQDEELHHLLRTRIRNDKKRVDRWLTPDGGGLTAAGIGGPITGRGADLMLIDDYIKNFEEAMSLTHHEKVWEWFKSTAYTRLEPGASLVILATRWAQKDLIGRCLTELPHENWKLINLPALAMENDPLGRTPGEPLWPERYDLEALLKIKATLGSFWWDAQCQQMPRASMAGMDLGDMIEIVSPSDVPEDHMKWVRAWDLASTEGGGDYTAGPKIGIHKSSGRVFISDLQHFQKSPFKVKQMVMTCAEGDGHGVPIWMEQEPGSSGKTVIEDYKKMLSGWHFRGEKATGPGVVRASPFLAACEAGRVKMVKAKWNDTLREEVNAFGDDAEHDDIVIALALGYNKLVSGLYQSVTWGRPSVTGESGNVIPMHQVHGSERKERRSALTW